MISKAEEKFIERIVEIAIMALELKHTENMSEIRLSLAGLPEMVNKKITHCQDEQEKRRRWSVGTFISFGGVMTGVAALALHAF